MSPLLSHAGVDLRGRFGCVQLRMPRSKGSHPLVNVSVEVADEHCFLTSSVSGNEHDPVAAFKLSRALNEDRPFAALHFATPCAFVGATSPRTCGGRFNICKTVPDKQFISHEISSGVVQ